jgi:hypothetical protein
VNASVSRRQRRGNLVGRNAVRIIRVDPVHRKIAQLLMKPSSLDAIRVCRAAPVGYRQLLVIDEVPLMVAGGMDASPDNGGWRIGGSDNTAGISFLFGQGPGGGMVNVPVDQEWLEERIIWVSAKELLDPTESDLEVVQNG